MRRNYQTAMQNVQQRIAERQKLITYEEASIRYSLGTTTLRKMSKQCGAFIKIGNAARIDVEIMDKYIETFRV